MGGTVQCGDCCPPPPTPCLSICWLCAGSPGSGFSEVLGQNQTTGRYEGKQSRATVSGNTATVQRLCNGIWSPDPGFPVVINQGGLKPPFTIVPDNCCPCGNALVCVTQSCLPPNPCGLGCEGGVFGSPYNQLPADWDVPIGASLTNLGWNSCSAMSQTYTLSGGVCSWFYSEGIGIVEPGANCGQCQPCGSFLGVPSPACPTDPDNQCCNTDFQTGLCDGSGQCFTPGRINNAHLGDCSIYIQLDFKLVTCGGQFTLTMNFGCSCQDYLNNSGVVTRCNGTATYTSDVFPAISPVPTSVTLHGGGTTGPACSGNLPTSITITAA